MEVQVSGSELTGGGRIGRAKTENDRVRVKRKALEAVLEECQRALQLIGATAAVDSDEAVAEEEESGEASSGPCRDREADELCDLLKSRVECPDFLEKLESAQDSIPQSITEEGNSWDMVNENDLWEGDLDHEEYVLIRQEDIVEGIACFMAAYLLSLKDTKDLTPTQLQEALRKTFSVKNKRGKLRKAWDGSKVIYNLASWGATAIGIYQNPALLRAASAAFWTPCRVISKIL